MENSKTRLRSRRRKKVIDFIDGPSPTSVSAPLIVSKETLKSLSVISNTTERSKKRKHPSKTLLVPEEDSEEIIDFAEHLENQLKKHRSGDFIVEGNNEEREEPTENFNQGREDEVFQFHGDTSSNLVGPPQKRTKLVHRTPLFDSAKTDENFDGKIFIIMC